MSKLVCYKDLNVGDVYCNTLMEEYCLKLSEYRYFSFDKKKIYGFCDNKKNDSDNAYYIKCDFMVVK